MKKSLIALAVAGTFAVPAMAATSNVDIYGKVRASVDHINSDAANSDRWTFNDQTSRVGIKGSEDLGGGLKAIFQWESQLNSVDNGGVSNTTQRNTFIGLAGGFGTLILGTHDTPYKLGGSADVFADTSADSQKNTTGIIGRNGFDNRAAGTIAYVSPDFSGFSFAGAIVPGEGTGVNAANGLMDVYSLMGSYANGPLKASLSYENWDKKVGGATAARDNSAWKFNIAYKMGDIGLGYTYERSRDGYGIASAAPSTRTAAMNSGKDTAHLASITYGMGPITLAGQYGKFNNNQANTAVSTDGVNSDLTRWTLGAIYSLSKRTNAYVAYDMDNYGSGGPADAKIFTVGMNHDF